MSIGSVANDDRLRNPLDSFTDREYIRDLFTRLLQETQRGQFRPLGVKGNSGTGKTLLISYLAQRICTKLGWQVGQISVAESTLDYQSVLTALGSAFKECVPSTSLERYREMRDECLRRYRAEVTVIVNQGVEAKDNATISGVNQSVQIDTQSRIRERELHLRAELSRLLRELAEESEHPFCMFIDGYERIAQGDPEFIGWLWEDILPGLARDSPYPFIVMICGWGWPDNPTVDFLTYELTDFGQEQIDEYLRKQEVLSATDSTSQGASEELTRAFYDLTRGHPLVLSLAVTYFKQLPLPEQTVDKLHSSQPLIDERARVTFLQNRLLARLPDLYKILLERGPILRSLDLESLRVLVSALPVRGVNLVLDLNAYTRFLEYPFINQQNMTTGDSTSTQPGFHELVRRIGLESLRHHDPAGEQLLHAKMADYYEHLADIQQQASQTILHQDDEDVSFEDRPDKAFRVHLEYFYHAFQVKERQSNAFEKWDALTIRALQKWQHRHLGLLLALVQQLIEEGEPFLHESERAHHQYLLRYARYLMQEFRWREAQIVLEKAIHYFEQVDDDELSDCFNYLGTVYDALGDSANALLYQQRSLVLTDSPIGRVISFLNMGDLYRRQGKLTQALESFLQAWSELGPWKGKLFIANMLNIIASLEALPSDENKNTASNLRTNLGVVATVLNNIGQVYLEQGQLDEAFQYHEQALDLREQVGSSLEIANSLNNIALVYRKQGQLAQALSCLERTLAIREKGGDPSHLSHTLINLGNLYSDQGKLEQALNYYERSLHIAEQTNSLANMVTSLGNIGSIYTGQGKLEQAATFLERALSLAENLDYPAKLADTLMLLSSVYKSQEKLAQALNCLERALPLLEQVGNPSDLHLCLMGIGRIYREEEQFETALPYLERALALSEEVNDLSSNAATLNIAGFVYLQLGAFEQSLRCYEHALRILEEQKDDPDQIIEILIALGDLHQKSGKEAQAHYFYQEAAKFCEQICVSYLSRSQWKPSLHYLQKVLSLREQISNPQ